jgi:hypothetical protein
LEDHPARTDLFKGSELGMSARWTLPLVDCELSINENPVFYCIEIVNYETGVVVAHIDLYKDNAD